MQLDKGNSAELSTELESETTAPLVSYLIPSFNHRDFIKQSIDSVLCQTYKNIELIVIDDCSTDESDVFLSEYSKEKGFFYKRNESNVGAVGNTNLLIKEAHGTYLCFLASDDWIEPDKTEKQVCYLQNTGKDAVLGPCVQYFQKTGASLYSRSDIVKTAIDNESYLELIYQYDKGGCLMQSGMFRTEAINSLGGYLPDYKADDLLFMIRFLQGGYTLGYLDDFFLHYRVHDRNSFRDPKYTLEEYVLPVVRDFVPDEYKDTMRSSAYNDAAKKYIIANDFSNALKCEIISQRIKFSIKRLGVFIMYPIYSYEPIRLFYNKLIRKW